MNDPIGIGSLRTKLVECMRDERGAAMVEYLLVTGVMVPVAAYLFHPDNGLYQALRTQYDLTMDVLQFYGP